MAIFRTYAAGLGLTQKLQKHTYRVLHERHPWIQAPAGHLPIKIVQFSRGGHSDGHNRLHHWAIFIPKSTKRGVGNFYEISGSLQSGYFTQHVVNNRHPKWDQDERGSHLVGWVAPSGDSRGAYFPRSESRFNKGAPSGIFRLVPADGHRGKGMGRWCFHASPSTMSKHLPQVAETFGTMALVGSHTGYSTPPINDAISHESKSATAFNTNHCSAIIQALQVQDHSTELQTFNNVTPKEFEYISDKRSDWVCFYLLIMTLNCISTTGSTTMPDFYILLRWLPLPFMNGPSSHSIIAWESLQHPTTLAIFVFANSQIEGNKKGVILDLQLDLTAYYETAEEPVGTRQNAPTIDAVFMINISSSFICYLHIPIQDLPLAKLSPIVVGNVTWADIKSIELMVFIRTDNGKFNLKIHSGNPHVACGLLHPNISVEHVTSLLDIAARHLFTTITGTDIMENHHDNDHG
ncbi:hypothetical protein JVT61DRAFT_10054 [Boletus reticuloceps]|uniref:Uncharacterized protein n=1 Tax=Boletus reticuloceps TaxID=495285 RepID=A0A8I2YUE4_9AGAM|nr:hypothetical protein JVT61DRAFT_10054 [Boletus reticuloceps]